MQVDFKELRNIVDDVILTEAKCIEAIHSILVEENKVLHNAVLDKVICVMDKWQDTPPIKILKELEEFQGQQNTT